MTVIDTATLGDIVAATPAAARVFETFGLDYCCRGDRTLTEACAAEGVDAGAVTARLTALDRGPAAWTQLGMIELADHIVATHHQYPHEELPLLDALADKVLGVHGDRHPELHDIAAAVGALRADLEPHLAKEERVLFPAIRAIAAGQREFAFGTVENPIRMMQIEHDRAGEILATLRSVTNGYQVPADGCASYHSLFDRLHALEADTHDHIHKENHTLFPAAIRTFLASNAAAFEEDHDHV